MRAVIIVIRSEVSHSEEPEGKINSKGSSTLYREGWDRIFSKEKEENPLTGEKQPTKAFN